MRPVFVQKYGGTSLGRWDRLQEVANIIQNDFNNGAELFVVVSAMSGKSKSEGTTSQLITAIEKSKIGEDYETTIKPLEDYHQSAIDKLDEGVRPLAIELVSKVFTEARNLLDAVKILGDVPSALEDNILSAGEKISALIITQLLRSQGLPAEYLDFSNLMPVMNVSPDITFLEMIIEKLIERPEFKGHTQKLFVIPGYLGRYPGGILNAVGRGYSDVTGGLIACAVKAKEYQIWKEVDGVMTADPRVVEAPIVLSHLTTEEAIELSAFGMQAVHAQAAEAMHKHKISVRIKNVLNPKSNGTLIDNSIPADPNVPVRAVTALKDITVVNIVSNKRQMGDLFLAEIFRILNKYKIKTELISISQTNISICVNEKSISSNLRKELDNWGEVTIFPKRAIISIVGSKMKHIIGIAGRTFNTLAGAGVNIEIISQGATEISISAVVKEEDVAKAVQALHSHYIEKKH